MTGDVSTVSPPSTSLLQEAADELSVSQARPDPSPSVSGSPREQLTGMPMSQGPSVALPETP